MAYDIHDLKRMARVLSACSGVRNLTIWAIPSSQISLDTQLNPNLYPPTSYELRSSSQSVAGLQNLTNKLRPQRLAVLLDKPLHSLDVIHDPDSVEWTAAHPFSNFSPNFFSHLTHLSIVNRWTEWSTWFLMPPGYSSSSHTAATGISHERSLNPLRLFPRLTHLSLEIRVSNRSVTQQRGFTSLLPFPRYEGDNTLTHCVSRALTEILTNPELSSKLQVLLCILSFDDLPFLTARKIREQTLRGLNTTFGKERAQAPRSPFSVPAHPESDCWEPAGFTESSLGDRHCRLVFAHDREPFRDREAGSWKVFNMWRLAEEMVCRQKQERVLDSYGEFRPVVVLFSRVVISSPSLQ